MSDKTQSAHPLAIVAAAILSLCVSPAIAQNAKPARFEDVVNAHFAHWDLNHDGKLEAGEIDKLMNNKAIRGEAAAALAVLKQRERQTSPDKRLQFAVGADEVGDLEAIGGPAVAIDAARGAHRPFNAEGRYKQNLQKIDSLVPRLFVGKGPNFETLHQGPIGDCYFFCMVGYLAVHTPAKIHHMIEPDPHGDYHVRFFDGETFAVPAPTEAEMIVNNSAGSLSDGTWLCVLEKAVGERMRQTTKKAEKRTAEATDAMAAGGSTESVIALFSGHKSLTIKLRDPAEAAVRKREIRRDLAITLAHHRLAAVSMGDPPAGQNKVPGLGYHHAYAILGFDPANGQLKVWNPWGQHFKPKGPEGPTHGFATEHGVFKIPLDTFYQLFSSVHLETTERATHLARPASRRR